MADLTQEPTVDDLKQWLTGSGIVKDFTKVTAANVDYETTLAAVVREWKRATGYKTGFLSSGSSQTFKYSGRDVDRRGVLRLECGLITFTSFLAGTTALTQDTDFELNPLNAPLKNEPFKTIRFLSGWDCLATYSLTGIMGYATEYPPDVWVLLLARAAQRCFPQLGLQISGGVAAIKADDVSVQFVRSTGGKTSTGGPLSQETDTISKWWRDKVLEYRL